ncbi:MAG: hypothetical protein WCO68_08755 [Verrucomicrobiota bacterium]
MSASALAAGEAFSEVVVIALTANHGFCYEKHGLSFADRSGTPDRASSCAALVCPGQGIQIYQELRKSGKRQKKPLQSAYFSWDGIHFSKMGDLLSLILFLSF